MEVIQVTEEITTDEVVAGLRQLVMSSPRSTRTALHRGIQCILTMERTVLELKDAAESLGIEALDWKTIAERAVKINDDLLRMLREYRGMSDAEIEIATVGQTN